MIKTVTTRNLFIPARSRNKEVENFLQTNLEMIIILPDLKINFISNLNIRKDRSQMGIWEIILFTISLIIMIVGMAGIIVPIIPSTPLIWFGVFFYAIFTHFEKITWIILLIFAMLTIFSIVLENLGNIYGAKRFGATRWGIIGSIAGTGVGFYMGGPIGLILGPIVGTIIFEIIGGKDYAGALKSGLGNFVGFMGGSVIKIIIGLAMISIFIWKVFVS